MINCTRKDILLVTEFKKKFENFYSFPATCRFESSFDDSTSIPKPWAPVLGSPQFYVSFFCSQDRSSFPLSHICWLFLFHITTQSPLRFWKHFRKEENICILDIRRAYRAFWLLVQDASAASRRLHVYTHSHGGDGGRARKVGDVRISRDINAVWKSPIFTIRVSRGFLYKINNAKRGPRDNTMRQRVCGSMIETSSLDIADSVRYLFTYPYIIGTKTVPCSPPLVIYTDLGREQGEERRANEYR